MSTRSVTSDEELQFFLSVTRAWLLKQQSLYNNFKQIFFCRLARLITLDNSLQTSSSLQRVAGSHTRAARSP